MGLASSSPFLTVGAPGTNLAIQAMAAGLAVFTSWAELSIGTSLAAGWYATFEPKHGRLHIGSPLNPSFVADLELEWTEDWLQAAEAHGSVLLVTADRLTGDGNISDQLAEAISLRTVCAGWVRYGCPTSWDDIPESPTSQDVGQPVLRIATDPVGTVLDLAILVDEGVLSLAEAKRRAVAFDALRTADWVHESDSDAALFALLLSDEMRSKGVGLPMMCTYMRLVAEIADHRGGPDSCPAWNVAAQGSISLAVDAVAHGGGRQIYEEANSLAQRLIAYLRTVGDDNRLAAALLDAARLRIATKGPELNSADHYAIATLPTWEAQLRGDMYRAWFTEEEPFQTGLPERLAEAGHFLIEALQLTDGRLRPRLLAHLLQIVPDTPEHPQNRHNMAMTAFGELLEPQAEPDPEITLFLIRVLEGIDLGIVREQVTAVFSTPLTEFLRIHGPTSVRSVIGQGINLARERRDQALLRTVLGWADELPAPVHAAQRRQLWEAQLHILPDDPTLCPAGHDLEELHRNLTLRARTESWAPVQYTAACLHLAAHAREQSSPALGLALLRESGTRNGPIPAPERLLNADLYYLAATARDPVPGSLSHRYANYSYAACGYASLDLEDLAQACLIPFAMSFGDFDEEQLRQAIYTIIVDAPNIDTGGAPRLARVLRDLIHTAVWEATAHCEQLPIALLLGLQHVGKGPERAAWTDAGRPFVLPGHLQHWLARLRGVEAESGPGNLPAAGLLTPWETDSRPAGSTAADLARNLRHHIHGLIDQALQHACGPVIDEEHPWAHTRSLLDERTLLLTWFLPEFARGVRDDLVLVACTRECTELFVVLGDDETGTPRDRHVVADEVAAVRAEILAHPLFKDVTPEGARLLAGSGDLFGDRTLLTRWRERGKDHLLLWPHGALHYFPLHLCTLDDRLIAEDWTVTTIIGLDALTPTHPPAIRVRKRRTAVVASACGGAAFGLQVEPALEDHADEIAAAAGTRAVTGKAATRGRLLEELASADIVHIAVHGTLDPDAPWFHCLYLSPDHDDDGRVFAYDLLGVDLRGVRLVTLAACESGLSRFDLNDNIRGIPSALLTAGVGAVAGCLWPVRPEPATFFFREMHRAVADGTALVPAFRRAQLATRTRHPHYRDWAAFTYVQGRSYELGKEPAV